MAKKKRKKKKTVPFKQRVNKVPEVKEEKDEPFMYFMKYWLVAFLVLVFLSLIVALFVQTNYPSSEYRPKKKYDWYPGKPSWVD